MADNANPPNPDPKPDDQPPGDEPDGKEEKQPPGEDERKFSQSDVDAAVKARLARERANLKELQEKAKRLDEIEAANKSDAERLTAAQAEAEAKAQAAETRLRSLSLKNAVAMACLKAEVSDVEVVQSLIGDPTKVEFDEDGEPIGIADRVRDIVKARPYLKGSKFQGTADGGRAADRVDPTDPEALGAMDMDKYLEARSKWNKT